MSSIISPTRSRIPTSGHRATRRPKAMFSATVMVGKRAYDWKTMPRPRWRGGTPPIRRSSNQISPASGASKPAIMRSVVVLPHPEPPPSETGSPSRPSRESPSTATAEPKRLLRPRSVIFMSARVLPQPRLDESVLVFGIAGLHEIEVDEVHLRDLRAAHGDVGAGEARAPPGGVGAHRRPGDRPVEEAPGVLRILGALHQRVALECPGHAVGGMDDVDGRPLLAGDLHLVGERDADRRFARGGHAPRRAARLGHLRRVLVERVVVLPHPVLAEPGGVARQQEVGDRKSVV